MTGPQFEWLIGMPAAYQPTAVEAADDLVPVPGIIEEVRDDAPTRGEQPIRIVLKTETGLVDVAHDCVEVLYSSRLARFTPIRLHRSCSPEMSD